MAVPQCMYSMTEENKVLMGLSIVWITIREYRTVNGTPEAVKSWDDFCVGLWEARKAGDLVSVKFGMEQNLSPEEKRFFTAVTWETPDKVGQADACHIIWPEYACYCNWAARQPIEKLEQMSPSEMAYACEQTVKQNGLYSGTFPAPAGAPDLDLGSGTSWLPWLPGPWLIGGAVVLALGGVAYAFMRSRGPLANPVTNEIKKELGETIAKLRQLDPKMTEMYVFSYLENQRDASGYMKHVPLSAAKKKEIVARLRELRRRPPEATTSYVVAELVRLVELAEKKGSKAEGKLFVVWSKRLLDFYPVRSNTWEGAVHKLLDLHKGPIPESLQTDVTVWEMLNTNEEGTQFSVHSVDRYGGIDMDLTYKVPWEVQYYFGLRR